MWTVVEEKKRFERTTDNSSSDNATLRHRKICQDPPHDQISHFWSVSKQNPIAMETITLFLWIEKCFVIVSKRWETSWSTHVDCFKKAGQPVRSCLAFLKQKRRHLRSFLIIYALSFDVFKITLLTGRGYPPSFLKRWNPLASEHRGFTCCLL